MDTSAQGTADGLSLSEAESAKREAINMQHRNLQGVDVNQMDAEGLTKLMHACLDGNELFARALVKAGADVEKQKPDGFTALMISAQYGHDMCSRALIENHADLEKQTLKGFTALMISAEHGHDLCARALLEVSCPPRTLLPDPHHSHAVLSALPNFLCFGLEWRLANHRQRPT